MILYVVTHGSYSDYGISAIFSTEEAAREFITTGGGDKYIHALYAREEARIELYELDNPERRHDETTPWPIPIRWSVRLARDGTIVQIEMGVERVLDTPADSMRFHQVPYDRQWVLDVECMAMSREHAIKIANEKLTQFVAEGKWDTP